MGKVSEPNWLVRQIMLSRREAANWSQWKRDAYRAALEEDNQ